MNDKIKMLEAKKRRVIGELEQIELALRRAHTGYVSKVGQWDAFVLILTRGEWDLLSEEIGDRVKDLSLDESATVTALLQSLNKKLEDAGV